MKNKTLTFWSTIFAGISALAAFATVWQAVYVWRQSVEAERPYVDISSPIFMSTPHGIQFRYQIENVGKRAASDVFGKNIVIDQSQNIVTSFGSFSFANDLFPKAPIHWLKNYDQVPYNLATQVIITWIKYFDPVTKKYYKQIFFMKWEGIKNGNLSSNFFQISIEEKQGLIKQFKRDLKGYL